jgi:sigma-B regulation protein RsbU (phosphoserine phosphatase)
MRTMTAAPEIRRALVVEDDVDIRGLLVQILKREGFEVTEAATAREGLEKARAGADLITRSAVPSASSPTPTS